MRLRHWLRLLPLALLLSVVAGCGNPPSETLTVLAGSELKDLAPLLGEIERETGVHLEMEYIGTLDGAEQIVSGQKQPDLAWFSHGKYLSLLMGSSGRRVLAQERIMLSPVVLGIKQSKARAFGWLDKTDLTWRDIAERARSGELRFAMTDPASSNSGFTALLGVTAAFSNSADAVAVQQVDSDALRAFFHGQKLTAGSSGWLAQAYVDAQQDLDGLINYESVLLQLNQGGRLNEPLYLIYPQEGIVTADYPLMLLQEAQRPAYERLVAYLRSPPMQQRLMAQTQRRPAIPQVRPDGQFPARLLVELPFPARLEVIDAILTAYQDEHRRPSHSFYVLDVSGSMRGPRIAALRQALDNLTGLDSSLSGRFARFRSRERITLLPFAESVQGTQAFVVDADPQAREASMAAIRRQVGKLEARGGTAIYSALMEAYRQIGEAQRSEPDRFYSVVLLTDGASNQGGTEQAFFKFLSQLPAETRAVRTFPVLFGESDQAAMERLAQRTGGQTFNGMASLAHAFKQIRGYQ